MRNTFVQLFSKAGHTTGGPSRALFPAIVAFSLIRLLSFDSADGQQLYSGEKWFHVGRDSIRVAFAWPATLQPLPAVVVLADRFGVRQPVEAMLPVFARLGYRAYAVPLRSQGAGSDSLTEMPRVDSSDEGDLAQVVVDIRNEKGCSGDAVLFAFDVGAAVGAEAAARLPLFKAAMLFYPRPVQRTLAAVRAMNFPAVIYVGDSDPAYPPALIADMRDTFTDARTRVRVNVYSGTGAFFFHQGHPSYNAAAMKASWADAIRRMRDALAAGNTSAAERK